MIRRFLHRVAAAGLVLVLITCATPLPSAAQPELDRMGCCAVKTAMKSHCGQRAATAMTCCESSRLPTPAGVTTTVPLLKSPDTTTTWSLGPMPEGAAIRPSASSAFALAKLRLPTSPPYLLNSVLLI